MRGLLTIFVAGFILSGCRGEKDSAIHPRDGDEIVIAGKYFDIGTKVVLWNDPGGFDGYANPYFGQREGRDAVAWDLAGLREAIDQFVIHYDGCGSSATCFRVLNERGLSVHFMLDTDGTIYQMLDVKERAWHATRANDRSVGVEIANIGAYPMEQSERLDAWYRQHAVEPMTRDAVEGEIQKRRLRMYDLTAKQYEALIKLTAGLCKALPRIECDYPRATVAMSDAEFASFRGVLGHYHVQPDKVDPGPAFQWDRVIDGAQAILRH